MRAQGDRGNTGSPKRWPEREPANRNPARDRLGLLGWRMGPYERRSRVTLAEQRDPCSRQTQEVAKDKEIGS
jgi:hypothetical protein